MTKEAQSGKMSDHYKFFLSIRTMFLFLMMKMFNFKWGDNIPTALLTTRRRKLWSMTSLWLVGKFIVGKFIVGKFIVGKFTVGKFIVGKLSIYVQINSCR